MVVRHERNVCKHEVFQKRVWKNRAKVIVVKVINILHTKFQIKTAQLYHLELIAVTVIFSHCSWWSITFFPLSSEGWLLFRPAKAIKGKGCRMCSSHLVTVTGHWSRYRWIIALSLTHGQCNARPTLTFPAAKYCHCDLVSTHYPFRWG